MRTAWVVSLCFLLCVPLSSNAQIAVQSPLRSAHSAIPNVFDT